MLISTLRIDHCKLSNLRASNNSNGKGEVQVLAKRLEGLLSLLFCRKVVAADSEVAAIVQI